MYLTMPGKYAGFVRLIIKEHRIFSIYCRTDRLPDQADNLTVIRKTVQLFFGKNLLFIDTDDIDPCGTRN